MIEKNNSNCHKFLFFSLSFFFSFFWTIMTWNIVIVMIIHLSILLEHQRKCHSQKIITWKLKPIMPNNTEKRQQRLTLKLIKSPLIALWLQQLHLDVDIFEMRCQRFHIMGSNCGTRRSPIWEVRKEDHSRKNAFLVNGHQFTLTL